MEPERDVNQRIEELLEQVQSLHSKCLERSATRVAKELKRLAKAERRLIPYLHANFHIMNNAQSTMEVELGIETAIETIALLESEEKARQFQPDFPQDQYQETVHWMSACAYDNLAKHVAARDGYNSEGVHDAVNEGIEVCRRTGKLECITCFREYATSVFRAAGDVEMSLHHARCVATGRPGEDVDRRWVGCKDTAEMLMLNGQLADARDAAVQALSIADTYHTPLLAKLDTWLLLETILLLQGKHEEFEDLCRQAGQPYDPSAFPPPEERLAHHLSAVKRDVVAACCRKEYDRAVELLTDWDRRLMQLRHVDNWLDVRLRLVAVHVLAGNRAQAEALAKPLRERARKTQDWLTLGRVHGVLDGIVQPSPVAFLASASEGPFAPPMPILASAPQPCVEDVDPQPAEPPAAEESATPMSAQIGQWLQRLNESEGDEKVLGRIVNEVLGIAPPSVTHPDDVAWMIYLLKPAAGVCGRLGEAWRWAEPFARQFPAHAAALNVLADLGHAAREEAGEPHLGVATAEQVDSLFRASLDLNHEHARNFARAGLYCLDVGRTGEAERCLARSSNLDRSDPIVALSLAEIYAESDRPRDALAVLDMAIREGCDDPRVAWQAGVIAVQVERHDAALSYFDRYESLQPGEAWVQYYRARALIELERPREALAALEIEAQRSGEGKLHLEVLRGVAKARLDDVAGFRGHLQRVLATPLAQVDYLTLSGLIMLFEKIYAASACLPPEAPELADLRKLLLAAGLAPDDLFVADRKQREAVDGVHFFRCAVRQPLDERWPDSPGCLAGPENWAAYRVYWGVLARDAEEATAHVLQWQSQCCPLAAVVEECESDGETYTDSPGVVFQGLREPIDGEDGELSSDD
jgi:tetratricopeptide (TPR) repeat protein